MGDASGPPMALEFRILGPVEVRRDGVEVLLGPRRQRLVLVRLIVDHGRVVSVERLLDDVWGGEPPEGAVRTLRSYVSRLRTALAPDEAITTRPPGYRLVVDPDAVDAVRFAALAADGHDLLVRGNARAAAARLTSALSLWRGPALEDVPGEPFVAGEASRLDEQRLVALEDRIDADLRLGRHLALVAELEALLAQHPLRERLWALLMTALYRSGRQAEALEAYRRARVLLDAELGLEPGEDLQRLERAILRHDLAPSDQGRAHNLPTPLTALIGREREVTEVLDRLERARLVTLTGAGGAGKTRVAVEAAHRSLERFPDGVWMVDLAPLSDAALVPQTIADAVGIDDRARRSGAAVLAEHLAGVATLVLLDNCEHLADACADVVHHLLHACPRLRVLATSREPLAIAGEVSYPVPPLRAPPEGPDADQLAYDAVRLFVDRSAAPIAAEALSAVADVCRKLDGVPLAIEIAAAQTTLLSPDEIALRLADRFRVLSYWSRTAAPRHRTLRASLDWSYRLLAPHERALFHRLAVFAGGFTLPAVEAVTESEGSALEVLRRLVDASLVLRDVQAAGWRFRLLETVRQYAVERAQSTGDLDPAAQRHAAFFATLADRALAAIDTTDQPAVYAELDAEQANVRAALEHAYRVRDAQLLGRLARGVGPYWRLRGYFDEGETWLTRALDVCVAAPAGVRADLLGALGDILLRRSRFEAARSRLEDAVALLRAAPDTGHIGRWLQRLAYCSRAQGDFRGARAVAEEALALAVSRGDGAAASHHVGHLADLALVEGRLEEAQQLFDQAIAFVHPPSPGHLVAYLDSTARLAVARGDLSDAAERAGRGLAQARELGDLVHIGLNLMTLAYIRRRQGDALGAADRLCEAFALLSPDGELPVTAEAFDILAGLLLDRGEHVAAATAQGAADSLRRRAGVPPGTYGRPFDGDDDHVLQGVLGDDQYTRARSVGVAMAPAEALAFARAELRDTLAVLR